MQPVQRTEPTRRSVFAAFAAALLIAASSTGCRSRAHTDLYIDEMAAEIRVLEDQLYKCDYENEVLHQKLQRARARLEAGEVTQGEIERRARDAADADSLFNGDDAGDDLEMEAPDVELGVPEPPDIDPGTPPAPDVDLESFTPPVIDPGQEVREVEIAEDAAEELPPMAKNRISISPEIHKLYSEPGGPAARLVIDPVLSSGKTSEQDGTPAGIRLVVKAYDQQDRPTTVARPLSVSLLDPAREGDAARLGIWTFSAEELGAFRSDGSQQLTIDLDWPQRMPEGDAVLCFVRIETDDKAGPATDQLIPVRNKKSLTGESIWAPRGN